MIAIHFNIVWLVIIIILLNIMDI